MLFIHYKIVNTDAYNSANDQISILNDILYILTYLIICFCVVLSLELELTAMRKTSNGDKCVRCIAIIIVRFRKIKLKIRMILSPKSFFHFFVNILFGKVLICLQLFEYPSIMNFTHNVPTHLC